MRIPAREEQVVADWLRAIEEKNADPISQVLIEPTDVDSDALTKILVAVVFGAMFLAYDGEDPNPREIEQLAASVIAENANWLPEMPRDPRQLTDLLNKVSGRNIRVQFSIPLATTWLALTAAYLLKLGEEDWTVRFSNVLLAIARWPEPVN